MISKLLGGDDNPTKLVVALHSAAAVTAVIKAVNTFVNYKKV